MHELSPEARYLLAKLLDTATFVADDKRRTHDIVGKVYTEDGMPAAADVPKRAWVELVALTGKPDDVYAESGQRIGRLVGSVGGVPIVDTDG